MSKAAQRRFQEPIGSPIQVVASADRVALCGRFPAIGQHQHAAPAVVVGIDGPLRFVAHRSHDSRAALIAPGFSHAVDAGDGRVAVFMLPPHDGSSRAAPVRDLRHPSRWIDLGHTIMRNELTGFAEVDDCFRREGLATRPIDDRLELAIGTLAEALDENVSIAAAARAARLSPSRLMALAQKQLGTSLRRYRRWLRAFRVAHDYASGSSLTTAAFAAGFASSAHLSSATRAQFGIRPSDILLPNRRSAIRIVSPP